MLFLNPLLVLGLLGISIPILLHLFNRKSTKTQHWGAMRFLVESLASRTRRIELEDALLMAARCLLFAALALALARPFSPPGSPIPWAVVLPLLLLGIATFGVAFALWANVKLRATLLIASLLIFALVAAAVVFERQWNLRRLGGGEQDVALIIDASTSMTARFGDRSLFEIAVEEARKIIDGSGHSTAYSLILAGPSPVVLNGTPRGDRSELHALLSDARPSDGTMALPEALQKAAAQLTKGRHGGKRVLLITDGQAFGWDADNAAAWAFVKESFADLGNNPQLILRQLQVPTRVRNIALTGIAFGRAPVGNDRPVEIAVTIENTGTEAVTPGGVQLRVGDTLLENESLGQLIPGMRQTVRFRHHFKQVGAHAITARVLVEDAVADDDSLSRALTVVGPLKVLIVDGNPGGRLFDRASAFLSIALAPGMAEGAPFMIEPVVLPAPQILSIDSFDDYAAVVLADVPRLPAGAAAKIAAWVARGGGLLVAPGRRAEPKFYNTWTGSSGLQVMPAALDRAVSVPPDATPPVSPSLSTFDHSALREVADGGDFASVRIANYWSLRLPKTDPTVWTAAKLNTGEPFLTTRKLGAGTVFMSCIPFDNQASNLVTRSAFLPFVHEIVYHLSRPKGSGLDILPGASLSLLLDTQSPPGQAARYGVLDPRGATRTAELSAGASGTLIEIPGDAMAGLYEIAIPVPERAHFEGLLTAAGTVPFSVGRAAGESQLTPLSSDARTFIAGYFDLLQPTTTADALTILAGKSFGEELWKYLAVGALFLLLGEAALGRWIARSRKTGAEESVDFDSRRGPGKGFRRQLAKVRKGADGYR